MHNSTEKPSLLIASGNTIHTVIHDEYTNVGLIDYSLMSNYIIWNDFHTDSFFIEKLDKAKPSQFSNKKQLLKSEIRALGFAVDWIHDLVYWTNLYELTVEVAHLANMNETTILVKNADEPRAIAVCVQSSLLFWTDCSHQPKIESVFQDGTNRKVIVEKGLRYPFSLTIDQIESRIYWLDGMQSEIYACDFDGRHRSLIVHSPQFLSHANALGVFGDTVYWSDWNHNSITKVNKLQEASMLYQPIITLKAMLHDFKIVHSSKQPMSHNRCNSNQCSHLCLPHNESCYTCFCPPFHYISTNGFRCIAL
ncbi:very low-density lipoprotein receptor-like protein, partial [Leptotrombidium deliense]